MTRAEFSDFAREQEIKFYASRVREWFGWADEYDKKFDTSVPVSDGVVDALAKRIYQVVDTNGPSFQPKDFCSPTIGYSHKVVDDLSAIARQVQSDCESGENRKGENGYDLSGRALFHGRASEYLAQAESA